MQQITTLDSIMNEAFLYFFAEIEYLFSVFATFARSFGFTSPDSVGEE